MQVHESKKSLHLSEYQCGDGISEDCQSEYNNAINNGNLDYFYRRCATEGGSQPLRTRCSLCCDQGDPSRDYLHSVIRGCSDLNDNVQDCDEDSDSINSQSCICDTELCNDECDDCEPGPGPDGLKCYTCNPKDSWCDDIDEVIDHGDNAITGCSSKKCLISGNFFLQPEVCKHRCQKVFTFFRISMWI